jgi:stress response protein SCP2
VPLDLHGEPDLAAVLADVGSAYANGQSLTDLADRTGPQTATGFHIDDVTIAPMPKGANTAAPTAPITVALAWDPATAGADLDVSALLCGGDGHVLDPDAMVFYNQPVGAGGAVRCLGREQPSPTSSTDSDLPRTPAEIAKVVVAVSLDGSFAAALAAVNRLRVAVTAESDAVAVFPLTGLTTETAAVAIEVYAATADPRRRSGLGRRPRRPRPRLRHRCGRVDAGDPGRRADTQAPAIGPALRRSTSGPMTRCSNPPPPGGMRSGGAVSG